MPLRILSYNIRFGGGGREGALAAVIRAADPDVVMLQEATAPEVVAKLADATGMSTWGARMDHSTGFLSRVPVAWHAWYHPPRAKHAFLEVLLAPDAPMPGLRLFGLHLSAWFSNWSERRRTVEIGALLATIRQHEHGPHLVLGDFNALAPGERLDASRFPAWIRAMIWMSGRDIARTTIQSMFDRGYVDVWKVLHADAPARAGLSFPTWDPQVRLDYAFTPARDAPLVSKCEVVREPAEVRVASDHFPLLIELTPPPRR